MTLSILVTVGSDFHPFDRLVGGVDAWLSQASVSGCEAFVQYGTAEVPRHAEAHDFLAHADLMERLETCDIVVTQGGPMGIIEARRCGKVPIVMPRLKRLGEVVDDHQVTFCRQLASTGDIVLVEDQNELGSAMDKAVADPTSVRLSGSGADIDSRRAVEAFAAAVSRLKARRRWTALGARRPRLR